MPENLEPRSRRFRIFMKAVAAIVAVVMIVSMMLTGKYLMWSEQSTTPKTTMATTTAESITTTKAASGAVVQDGRLLSVVRELSPGLPPANSRSLNTVVVVSTEDPYIATAARHMMDWPEPWSQPPQQVTLVGRESTSKDQSRHPHNHKAVADGGSGNSSAATSDSRRDRTADDVTMDATDTRRNAMHRQIMEYRDYTNSETDDWKPVRDGGSTGGHRDPYDLTTGERDDNNAFYSTRPSDVDSVVAGENEPNGAGGHVTIPEMQQPTRYSTIKLPPLPSGPGGSPTMADLQPTGTNHRHQSWTSSYLPPLDASLRQPGGGVMNYNNNNNMVYRPLGSRYPPRPPGVTSYQPSRITAAGSLPYPIASGSEKSEYVVTPMLSSIRNAIDWKLIGTIALVKLGLVKFKAFVLISALLFLLFKLKVFTATVLFKFTLLLKFLKFFKVLLAPLLLALLSPLALGALYLIPRRILQSLLMPNNSSSPIIMPTLLPSLPTLSPSSQLINPTTGELSGVLAPGRPGATTVTRPSGQTGSILRPQTLTKFDFDSLQQGRHYDGSSPESFYPTLEIFRKLLDSEKCVERIACRMAAAEKSGTMPLWINWVLRGVSKYLPNEKLESYFKTFDGINIGNVTNSSIADGWANWCFERYDCNRANLTHVTNTKQ